MNGYLGHRETTAVLNRNVLMKQWTNEQQLSVVLLDEMDKAHPKFMDLFLGIFDTGKLSLGDNTTVDFTNTIFLLTGNIGGRKITDSMGTGYGLAASLPSEETAYTGAKRHAQEAARRLLRPEIYNRLDKVLVFDALTKDNLRQILDLELDALNRRLCANRGITVDTTSAVKDLILDDGLDLRYGARHLKRSLSTNLETPLADYILDEEPTTNIQAKVREGQVTFTTKKDPEA